MTKRKLRLLCAPLTAASALSGAAMAQAPIPFDVSDIYFELNATDRDVGLHGLLDADAWFNVKIRGPGGAFDVVRAATNQASPDFGLTELFFESNEPPIEERSFADLVELFPPGTYTFMGQTTEGEMLRSTDVLTTAMPCPPRVRKPRVVDGDLVIRWRLTPGMFNPDTEICTAGGPIDPVAIEVVVDLTDVESERTRKFTVEMPPGARRVEVPDEFLLGVDPEETEAKVEVLVIDVTGNRTAIEVEFEL